MHGDDAVVAHAAGRVQRGGHLGRVVGVVVDNDRAVALALDLKAAAGALELGRGALGVGGRQAQRAHAAAHGQGVVDIVAARHAQAQVREGFAELLDVELIETGAVFLQVDGAEAGFLLDAEREHRTVDGVHDVQGVAVVHIENDGAGQKRELLERELELAHCAVIVQVVVVDVEDDADAGRELQEGLAEFAGFDDGACAAARLAVAADQGQLAADDGGGVAPGQLQHGGDHAGGGRFAVGTGHADALRVQAADKAEQHAALHRFDAAGAGGVQLRVAGVDGRAVNDEVGIAEVGRVVADRDGHAHLALGGGDLGFLHIRAGQGQPAAVQDLDQRVHAGAAAADAVDMMNAFKQFGVVCAVISHWSSPQKKKTRRANPRQVDSRFFHVIMIINVFGCKINRFLQIL